MIYYNISSPVAHRPRGWLAWLASVCLHLGVLLALTVAGWNASPPVAVSPDGPSVSMIIEVSAPAEARSTADSLPSESPPTPEATVPSVPEPVAATPAVAQRKPARPARPHRAPARSSPDAPASQAPASLAPASLAPASLAPASGEAAAAAPAETSENIDADWRGKLGAWLQANRRYPEEARRRGEQGRVAVRFTVRRDGHVTQVDVVRASGSTVLDEAVVTLLRGAALPPFPATMGQQQATVSVQIQYFLDR